MNSRWKLVDERSILNGNALDFYNGVNVYIKRPHIVNQKVSAIEVLEECKNVTINDELLQCLEDDFDEKKVMRILSRGAAQHRVQELLACSNNRDIANINENSLIFRNLIPRHLSVFQEVMEVVVLNPEETSVTFYPKRSEVCKSRITPAFPYKITYIKNSSSVKLEILQSSYEEPRLSESAEWLKSKVFPKIIKWCQETPKYPIIPSIKLLSAKDYNMNLNYLKSKYAEKFVKIWPEYNNTDPLKYVYEDIAIAAYLITLWDSERREMQILKKQSFLDLGCGNGLLVHILSSEGHVGTGIDLRRRKIWDVYGSETRLIEKVIHPNNKQAYPDFDYDWIIGNHADELTPWIPVIASRTSYNTKVFLLPCCFFTFDGKYERIHANETQYQSYLKFLHSLCTNMGFHAEMDKLRIPSTKRTCIVCTRRNYSREMEHEIDEQRNRFIEMNLKGTTFSPKNENGFTISTWTGNEPTEEKPVKAWVPNFVPRGSVEKVQNCTQLKKEITSSIIEKVVQHLLTSNCIVAVQGQEGTVYWNQGGSLEMKELCSLLGPEMLKCMKTQNGGIQTFLRNHSFIFEVKDNKIRLKIPSNDKASSDELVKVKAKKRRNQEKRQAGLRKRNCYFHFNHPQGCPLSFKECKFSHDDVERLETTRLIG